MSYFDESKEVFKMVANSSFLMSTTAMKSDKMCYEFVLESGNGDLMVGIATSSSVRGRLYQNAGTFYQTNLNSKSQTGDAITISTNDPIMMCFDKSDTANYKLEATKGSLKRTYIFSCSSANSQTEWRIHLQNGSGSSNIEMRTWFQQGSLLGSLDFM